VTSDGPHYPLPYTGPNSLGLGKPLKPIVHPLRSDIPIWLGAEGPKNVAMTAEIADGWLPIYYSPAAADMYNGWLDEGFARPGARQTRTTFEIATNAQIVITDDVQAGIDGLRPFVAFYIGGMGAKDMNFHKEVFARMGYEKESDEIQDLFFEGKRDEAVAAVPDQMVQDISLIGTVAQIRDELQRWEEAGVTMIVVGATSVDEMRRAAEAILG
jgi:F420-dependent oxidoreductase-like protein